MTLREVLAGVGADLDEDMADVSVKLKPVTAKILIEDAELEARQGFAVEITFSLPAGKVFA